MPWEKSFDVDRALDRAMRVFWKKGYEAASMSDLIDSMEINRGSLYNAFGSKKELFTRALDKFDRDNRQKLVLQLEELDDPVTAIETLFDTVVAESSADPDKKGCLLVNTALELPNHSTDVVQMIDAIFKELEVFFKRQIKLGQKRGMVPETVKAKQTAKTMVALMIGLRVLARRTNDEASMRAIRDDALRLIGT